MITRRRVVKLVVIGAGCAWYVRYVRRARESDRKELRQAVGMDVWSKPSPRPTGARRACIHHRQPSGGYHN